MFTRLRLFVLTIVSLVCVYPFIGNATPLKITSKERVEYQNQIMHFLQETYYTTLCLAITEQNLHKDVVEDLMAEDAVRYQPEFYLDSKRGRRLSPSQYLGALQVEPVKEQSVKEATTDGNLSEYAFDELLLINENNTLSRFSSNCHILFGIVMSLVLVTIVFYLYKNITIVSIAKNDSMSMADAIELYGKGKYKKAVMIFTQFATDGDATAQYILGGCYKNGLGVSQDYNEAVKWFRKSAEQGYAFAQCDLGDCYYNGLGVSQDYNEAVKWYRKSAEQGDAFAQCNLGICYYNGLGVSQDYNEAVKWYRKSAEQGDASAQCILGYCYYNGLGVSQDYNEAVKWYRKSAEQGNASAQCNLGNCYYNGLGVSQDYNEAVKWYRKSAEQGDASAQNNLGDCYEYGRGVPIDIEEAKKWHQRFLSNKNRNE